MKLIKFEFKLVQGVFDQIYMTDKVDSSMLCSEINLSTAY